jgi:two-component system, OmpR family, phosphate regulon response regulator PhoB
MQDLTASPTLLVVDDERNIVRLLSDNFAYAGFRVYGAGNCDEAEHVLDDVTPDVVLMDWNLPGMSGVQYIKKLRRSSTTAQTAILMVSARSSDLDVCEALESGADDYIRKPFSIAEVIKRVKAVLRQRSPGLMRAAEPADASSPKGPQRLQYGYLEVDEAAQRVYLKSEAIDLGATELRILTALMRAPGRLMTRDQLRAQAWGRQHDVESRTVDVHISRLRVSLGNAGVAPCIETVRNEGYRLRPIGPAG